MKTVSGRAVHPDWEHIGRSNYTKNVWMVMNELMDAIAVTNPRLYDATMRKLAE